MLAGLRQEVPDILIDFFRRHHDALKNAFRTIEDINRLHVQDATVRGTGPNELARLSALDAVVHPAYLRLAEAVAGVVILPVAQWERRKRSVSETELKLHVRLEEAARGSLRSFLKCFDRSVRNAIAHGSVVFRDATIEYRDRNTVEHTLWSAFELFDRAVDVCNGLMLAYRMFFAEAREFFVEHGLTIPLPVVMREIQAVVELPYWRLVGAVETAYLDDAPVLRLLVETTFPDDRVVYMMTATTAAVAEVLAPGFDWYEIHLDDDRFPKGIGIVKADRLRELRVAGVQAPLDVATVFEKLLVFPKIVQEAGEVSPAAPTASKPFVRWARLVRKAEWLQLNAYIILEMADRTDAREYTRRHVSELIELAETVAREAVTPDLRVRRLGAAYIQVFMRDARQRDLEGNKLRSNLLCRIVTRHVGPIQDWPLFRSDVEPIENGRIEWNAVPFGDD